MPDEETVVTTHDVGVSDAKAANLDNLFAAMNEAYDAPAEEPKGEEPTPPEKPAPVSVKAEEPEAKTEEEAEPEPENVLDRVAKRFRETAAAAGEGAVEPDYRAEVDRLRRERDEDLKRQLAELQAQLKEARTPARVEEEDETIDYSDPAIVAAFERMGIDPEAAEKAAPALGKLAEYVAERRLEKRLKPLEEKLRLRDEEATQREAARQLGTQIAEGMKSVYQDDVTEGEGGEPVLGTAAQLLVQYQQKGFDSYLGQYLVPAEYRPNGAKYGQVPPALTSKQTVVDAIRSLAAAFDQVASKMPDGKPTSAPQTPGDAGIASKASSRSRELINPKPELTPDQEDAEKMVQALFGRKAVSSQLPAEIWE